MSYDLNPLPITATEKLLLLDDDKWEDFIEDCIRELIKKEKYVKVSRLGGSGDKGRDICAYLEQEAIKDGSWDLYQAKYYRSTSMGRSNFFPELAKFFDMVISKQYSIPRKYYLCALKIGSTLHDCFINKSEFKKQFKKQVIEKKGVLNGYEIKSNIEKYLSYVENFDFSIFDYYIPKDLLEIHSTSPNHWKRFGELPLRGTDPIMPTQPTELEAIYINELLNLYNDFTKQNYTLETLTLQFKNHLNAQRKVFFTAEGLKRFSRDRIPDAFETLLNDLLISIEVILYNFYKDNMEKHTEIIQFANKSQLTNNPLSHRLKPGDLSGCCHHLVNEEKLKWVESENI
ncbi:ABC-three component system protein [Acinetobacter pittii]|uniref:ABC-three component system protein n=1 Tax=Acinetobacter pittii TaxID=48296 RepID=UPI0032611895